jgi:hypothetical protein
MTPSTIAALMLAAVALAGWARQDDTADTWGQWDGNDDDE